MASRMDENQIAKSDLEATFDHYWRIFDGPPLEPEYRFDSERKYRFDRCHIISQVAIELDGGTWIPGGGRHNRASSFEKDAEKYNEAALKGWAVLRVTTQQVTSGYAMQLLERALQPVVSQEQAS